MAGQVRSEQKNVLCISTELETGEGVVETRKHGGGEHEKAGKVAGSDHTNLAGSDKNVGFCPKSNEKLLIGI